MPQEIAPDIALSFSPEAVHLQRRTDAEWHETDHVRFDDEEMRSRLEDIRDILLKEGHDGIQLIIPDDQLLYTRLSVDAQGPADMPEAVVRALDGLTPYAIEDLAFDWLPSIPGEVYVAAVARQTLAEARQFSERYGFVVNGFIADPDPERFPGEPEFAFAEEADVISQQSEGDFHDLSEAGANFAAAALDPTDEDEGEGDALSEARIAASINRLRELAAAHEASASAAPFYATATDFSDEFYERDSFGLPIAAEPVRDDSLIDGSVLDEALVGAKIRAEAEAEAEALVAAEPTVFITKIPPSVAYAIRPDIAPEPVSQVKTRPLQATVAVKSAKPDGSLAAAPSPKPIIRATKAPTEPAPIVRHGNADGSDESFLPKLPFLRRVFSGQNGVLLALLALLILAMLLIGMFSDRKNESSTEAAPPEVTAPLIETEPALDTPSAADLPQPVLPHGVTEDPLVDALREAIGQVRDASSADVAAPLPDQGPSQPAMQSSDDVAAPPLDMPSFDTEMLPASSTLPEIEQPAIVETTVTDNAADDAEEVIPQVSAPKISAPPAEPDEVVLPKTNAAQVADKPTLRSQRPAGKPAAPTPASATQAVPKPAPARIEKPAPVTPQAAPVADNRPASRPKPASPPTPNRSATPTPMPAPSADGARPPSRPSRSDAAAGQAPPAHRVALRQTPPVDDRAAFSFPVRLVRIEKIELPGQLVRYAQARPGRKPGVAAETVIDAPTARPASAASTVQLAPAGVSVAGGSLTRSQRPVLRPGAGSANSSLDKGSLALEQAIAAAIKDNPVAIASAPSAVPGALRSSALPPKRSASFVAASAPAAVAVAAAPHIATPVPPAPVAPAAAAIDADLQAQAEARFRARADADAQTEARARAEAEARARAQADAEERSARARGGAYRPTEVDDEPELASVGDSTTSAQVGQSATISRGLDPRRTTLIGVVGAGKASRGLIRLRNGKIVTVRVGDRIDGGAITAIGDGVVTYNVGGRARQLRILDGR